MKAAVGLALLAVGCADAPAATAADVHASWRCLPGVVEAPIDPLPAVAPHETPTPGEMTDEAMQANRLFDGNRFADAALALRRVVDGDTGDDQGNREIATYKYAIALYNMRARSAALEVFLRIAADHAHNKWRETELWLLRFQTYGVASDGALLERARQGLAEYLRDFEEVEHFQNPERNFQRDNARLVRGKIAYRNGDLELALGFYRGIDRSSEPLFAAAQECIALLRKKRGK